MGVEIALSRRAATELSDPPGSARHVVRAAAKRKTAPLSGHRCSAGNKHHAWETLARTQGFPVSNLVESGATVDTCTTFDPFGKSLVVADAEKLFELCPFREWIIANFPALESRWTLAIAAINKDATNLLRAYHVALTKRPGRLGPLGLFYNMAKTVLSPLVKRIPATQPKPPECQAPKPTVTPQPGPISKLWAAVQQFAVKPAPKPELPKPAKQLPAPPLRQTSKGVISTRNQWGGPHTMPVDDGVIRPDMDHEAFKAWQKKTFG